MPKKTVKELDLAGKRVLLRVDYNVPFDPEGRISDDSRIVKSIPTIRYLLEKGAALILISHLGRPEGRPDPRYSLRPVARHLSEKLKQPVEFIEECVGPKVEDRAAQIRPGQVVLLENLRFHPEEEKNDPKFAQALARLADLYVDDAFGAAHRAHASIEAITRYLPSAAGLLLSREIEYLGKALRSPERPFIVILGGAKVSDKMKIIANLLSKTDAILIGGAMAYPFCRIKGHQIGSSKYETGSETLARHVLNEAERKDVSVLLPEDHVIVQKLEKGAPSRVADQEIPAGWMGVDVGPKTVESFKKVLSNAKTILWNGPLGVFEISPFERGSREIARQITRLSAATVIGGGDTAAAIKQFGLEARMSHVSTGGGASLEYLEGKILPGIAALPEKETQIGLGSPR